MSGRTALLVGATGLVGRSLLPILSDSARYERVVVLARRVGPPTAPKVDWRVIDFDGPDPYQGLGPVHDVYCCLGTTIKQAGSQAAFRKVDFEYPLAVAKAAKAAGAERLIVVTAMGAQANSSVFYNRVKGELEQALAELGYAYLRVARPSLLLGDRPEPRLGERAATIAMGILGPVLAGPFAKYRGIDAATVARALYALGGDEPPGSTTTLSDHLESLGAKA